MEDLVLALNAGSSSLKYGLYRRSPGRAWSEAARGGVATTDPAAAVADVLARLAPGDGAALRGVGHRIVHGGDRFAAPVVLTPAIRAELQALVPLAPLHQPPSLAVVEAAGRRLPGVPQVACFDTAFHGGWAPLATLIPLPAAVRARGVRRYGFHGLSYEYVAAKLLKITGNRPPARVVVAHLGQGASLCALRDGRSVDASFGFTALDGLCMGTRPGALDPGVVLFLFQECGMSAAEVEDLLYRRSGLLGISGISGDMRELLASPQPAARLAVDYFVHRAAREIGGLAAMLGGLDALVFTAGIGEHSAAIRARIAAACHWLGLEIDPGANAASGPLISSGASRVQGWVIPTDEEAMVARHAAAALGLGPG